ncbi:L,D-transpeptidase family protein [Amycolatopsis suaedae]|uniref:L,D-transpeptidase family protein n=1 Tax=Amycolatopsis suaedae TaxID=2510978 RepID=UPI0013EF0904|nr:L,D-transpeptidase family protein [Amycolatopsis suaedae]
MGTSRSVFVGGLLLVAAAGCSTGVPAPAPAPVAAHVTLPAAPPFAVLAEGAAGREVATLQATLRGLGFQVRRDDGRFDTETRHAVVAFQKAHGLPRTGVVDVVTSDRLRSPVLPRPRVSAPGFHVEVDLARQLVYLVRDGRVDRVYDASTGRDADGKRTPPGEYRISYQINGWRHAKLGPMWKPSYLDSTGLALHGGEPVEATPASNGCIRMTDPSVEEVYPLLKPGTRVLIY